MLNVHKVSFGYNGEQTLHNIDLDVQPGEIMCLLGPSGCGKTTLLRVIAGLETPQHGEILFDGLPVTGTPVHERDFGLMFQDYALFPHLNVAENILFGLRMHRLPRDESIQRLQEVLELVDLQGYENRSVNEISGGERQRVALARSLAPRPRLLMLDEPLGSLDAALREQLGVQLRTIIKQAGLTSIYVTHDQQEAFAIADRIAVMRDGCIEQIDAPQQLYLYPRTVFVARFLGLQNLVPVKAIDDDSAETSIGRFPLNWTQQDSRIPEALLIHPGGIQLTAEHTGASRPVLTGTISRCVFAGDSYRLTITLQRATDITFTFRLPTTETMNGARCPQYGEQVAITYDPDLVIPLWGSSPCLAE